MCENLSWLSTPKTKSMKLILVLLVCAAAAAAAPNGVKVDSFNTDVPVPKGLKLDTNAQDIQVQNRNVIINALIRQMFELIRGVINDGSSALGIPPLDPLNIDKFSINLPIGIINIQLDLKDIFGAGFGGFVVHTSRINFNTMAFDVDISFPSFEASAGYYDFVGNLFGAIPLYGRGDARFVLDNFRVRATLILRQSANGEAVLLDRIENPSFGIDSLKSKITGVIGGGSIDAIVNAMIEDVIIEYLNRFQGAVAASVSSVIPPIVNPFLEQLDTWKYIAPFVPNSM